MGYFSYCLLLCVIQLISAEDGFFWQITDVHIELKYSTTGDTNNDCRGSGSHKAKSELGLYGNFSCDSNMLLLEDSVYAMRRIHPKPDFILWTGDNVPHLRDADIDWDLIFSSINKTTSVITDVFSDTMVIPVLGNHDVHPYQQFPWSTFSQYCARYLTTGGWGNLIPLDQHGNWKKGAYYSVQVNPQLTIIVVNTFLYQFYEQELGDDPKGQFAWLTSQLQIAKDKNIKVIVTSHIPPGYQSYGTPFLAHPYIDRYLAIINRFSEVISTQIYAHLHRDTFRLFRDINGDYKSNAFLGPSITPWKYPRNSPQGNNPCIRLYNYDLKSKELLDYQQYCLNLTLANHMAAEGQWPPGEWSEIYRATQLYNVPNLNLTSAVYIYEQLKSNKTVFDAYFKNYFSGYDVKYDAECRGWQLCAIQAVTSEQVEKYCNGYNFSDVQLV